MSKAVSRGTASTKNLPKLRASGRTPPYLNKWTSSRSVPSYDPYEYTASNPRSPKRHNAQRPVSSRGKRLTNGGLHARQKYSAMSGAGSARHLPQTGILENSCRDSPQTRQSSGKTRRETAFSRPQHTLFATRPTLSAELRWLQLGSRLLEKTHLRALTQVPVYTSATSLTGGD